MNKLLNALRTLHDVCARMDLEREAGRPTEAEYRDAMRGAADAIAEADSGAPALTIGLPPQSLAERAAIDRTRAIAKKSGVVFPPDNEPKGDDE